MKKIWGAGRGTLGQARTIKSTIIFNKIFFDGKRLHDKDFLILISMVRFVSCISMMFTSHQCNTVVRVPILFFKNHFSLFLFWGNLSLVHFKVNESMNVLLIWYIMTRRSIPLLVYICELIIWKYLSLEVQKMRMWIMNNQPNLPRGAVCFESCFYIKVSTFSTGTVYYTWWCSHWIENGMDRSI